MIDDKKKEAGDLEGIEEYNELALLEDYPETEEDDDEIMEFTENEEVSSKETEDTELAAFDSAEIEETEFLDDDKILSIIESVLFATDKPVSFSAIMQAFQSTNVKKDKVRRALNLLMVDYADAKRGIYIEEVQNAYQIRTKVDNVEYLRRMQKARPFKLSGPALEVMSIVAYKQPLIKNEVDQIRGVESGHLMRALMDKRLIKFVGKSELPGKPMLYGTTKYFLEIFGLHGIKDLPSLIEIDSLIPEGIGEPEEEKENLASVSKTFGLEQGESYSESEAELGKIASKLAEIDTTTEFFEQEKLREKARQEAQRAKEIQEAIDFEEEVPTKDLKWLERYQAKIQEEAQASEEVNTTVMDKEVITDLQEQLAELEKSGEPHPATTELEDVEFIETEASLSSFEFDDERPKDSET